MTSPLHEERLDAVLAALCARGAESVLDLGCGPGALLVRLVREPRFRRIAGLDVSAAALREAAHRLRAHADPRDPLTDLIHGSFTDPDARLAGFDAAVLVETIEHLEPDRLSRLERTVFGRLRPRTVIVTTPNREFNDLLGVPRRRLRHPDHRFEWTRSKFRAWATGVAQRNGYDAAFEDVGGAHPAYGGPTQMAMFGLRGDGSDRAAASQMAHSETAAGRRLAAAP